jgi:sterol desaturase/sphingolipid hydroxylase (fatty acid hydroxylase superfamily)
MKNQANEKEMEKEINNLIEYEKIRYKRKGYGFIVAVIINLLFFYYGRFIIANMIPENLENEGTFHFFFVFIFHETIFISVNLYFALIYYLNLPFFERYKTTSEPWPWNLDKEKFKEQLKNTFKKLFINHFIILPIVILPNLIFNVSEFNLDMKNLPSFTEVCVQVALCVVFDDLFFYISHRTLHHKKLYSLIHKIHHEYKHTISISSEYAHWIEYLLGNLLASSIFPLAMGKNMHFVTYIMWVATITCEAADGHSGYDFSWSPHRILPLNIGSEYHYFHHLTFTGNYASEFYIWDMLGNTLNKYYLNYYYRLAKSDLKTNQISVEESKDVNPYISKLD